MSDFTRVIVDREGRIPTAQLAEWFEGVMTTTEQFSAVDLMRVAPRPTDESIIYASTDTHNLWVGFAMGVLFYRQNSAALRQHEAALIAPSDNGVGVADV